MTEPLAQISTILRDPAHHSFLVLSHHRPDGDAVGSQLALLLLLRGLGKQVVAWNDDAVPAKFRFLPASDLIQRPPATGRQDFDVVIAVDTSTWERVGSAAEHIGARKHFINIDHHVSNDRYAEINWIVPDAPASGQIVYNLVHRGGFSLTRDMATCLWAAISTDTGSFSYSNTTADCLRAAAALVDTKLDVGEISRHVYESYPYARLQMLQLFLANLKLGADGKLAWSWVTRAMFEQTGAKPEDTEGLIDSIRAIDGVVVAVLLEELPEPGIIRLSLRSKHPQVDVNQVAAQFQGGGHREAAGARTTGTPAEIEARVVAAVTDLLQKAGL